MTSHDPFDFESHLSRRINEALSESNITPKMIAPRFDLLEDTIKNSYILRVDLPGMEKDELDLKIKDGILIISGIRKNDYKRETENSYIMQRSFGSFSRSIGLPSDVDTENISASMENGVLNVTIKKTLIPVEEVKKITIQ